MTSPGLVVTRSLPPPFVPTPRDPQRRATPPGASCDWLVLGGGDVGGRRARSEVGGSPLQDSLVRVLQRTTGPDILVAAVTLRPRRHRMPTSTESALTRRKAAATLLRLSMDGAIKRAMGGRPYSLREIGSEYFGGEQPWLQAVLPGGLLTAGRRKRVWAVRVNFFEPRDVSKIVEVGLAAGVTTAIEWRSGCFTHDEVLAGIPEDQREVVERWVREDQHTMISTLYSEDATQAWGVELHAWDEQQLRAWLRGLVPMVAGVAV